MVSSTADDKEAVLITLTRPLIYIQPVALDKGMKFLQMRYFVSFV